MSSFEGSASAANAKVCEIADRAGHDVPMHVAQDIVNAVAEEIAAALQKRIPGDAPDLTAAKVQGAWRDAAKLALDFVR
jgi:hypothetical protein